MTQPSDSDRTPSTPIKKAPKKTLREVMADCVSALSLGPEDLDSVREAVACEKKRHLETTKAETNSSGTSIAQNEANIFAILKSNGLKQEAADEMKKRGVDTYSQEWWQEKVFPLIPNDDSVHLQSLLAERLRNQ